MRYRSLKIFIIFAAVLVGCTPQKKLNRLIKKHPELLQMDTIRIIDTVVVPQYTHDTTTFIEYHDSVTVINNERIKIKYFYDTLRETIHHEYTCYGDTVFSEKIVPYEKVVIQELTWWQKYGSAVMIGGFLLLFLLILKKFGKLLV